MNAELVEFTRRALAAGKERQEISNILRQAGWVEPDIEAALDAFADITFPIPVPRPKPYLSAREVFVYLILFAALYAAAFSLGALVFDLIDRRFPDPLEIQSPNFMRLSDDRIRWDISMIIVAFPLFFFTFRAVTRAVAKDPTKRASRPRKWLTYLTLFVAGTALVGDTAVLIYNMLGGELTIRFLLKVATIAIIAGGMFSYFIGDMRKEEKI
jgi:O-antigen/teichoic acid export membrane protein